MSWTLKVMVARLTGLKVNGTPIRILSAAGCLGVALQLGTGCAGNNEVLKTQIQELEERLKESERSYGRLTVKSEDLQDQLNLAVDRVESNRLIMERRGTASPLPRVVMTPNGNMETGVSSPPAYNPQAYPMNQAPQPVELPSRGRFTLPGPGGVMITPESQAKPQAAPQAAAPVAESDEEYVRVTITEDDLRKIVEEDGGSIGSVRLEEDYSAPVEVPRTTSSSRSSSGSRSRPVPRAEGSGGKAPVTDERLPVVPIGSSAAPEVVKAPISDSPMDVYKGALASYRTGDYSNAFNQFKAYLDMKPPRDYLDNAYYWLGECSFGLGQHEQAIAYFNRVIKQTPDGNKVPDAMLKASLAYKRLGRTEESKSILNNLIETYPSTNAAKLASDKLKAAGSDSQ